MADFFAQVIAEFRALGMWCVIHGPEVWLGLCIWCVISIAVVIGMWIAALFCANGRDDNERH